MLYDSICWTTYPNLIVKSQIDSSSCLRIVFKELMFLFCLTEQRYCDTNSPHIHKTSILNLWNQAITGNTLHNRRSLLAFRIIT